MWLGALSRFGKAISSLMSSITPDMTLRITTRGTRMWQRTLSLSKMKSGKRNATAIPTPTMILPQFSERAAASSSCERISSMSVLMSADGLGNRATSEGWVAAALTTVADATWCFDTLLPPRLRPIDSKKSCIPMTIATSTMNMTAHMIQSTAHQIQANMV